MHRLPRSRGMDVRIVRRRATRVGVAPSPLASHHPAFAGVLIFGGISGGNAALVGARMQRVTYTIPRRRMTPGTDESEARVWVSLWKRKPTQTHLYTVDANRTGGKARQTVRSMHSQTVRSMHSVFGPLDYGRGGGGTTTLWASAVWVALQRFVPPTPGPCK